MDIDTPSPSRNALQPSLHPVEALILDEIRTGRLKPGDRLGSARQLATRLDASYGAVRQSLELLAARGVVVRRPRAGTFIARQVNGSELPVPDAPTVQTSNVVGLLVHDIRTPDSALITRHLQDVCNAAGLEVLVSSTDNDRERTRQAIERHLDANVRGLVLVAPDAAKMPLETLYRLEQRRVPVVTYARPVGVGGWPAIYTDTDAGQYEAVKHLCDLGRRRIAYLTYPAAPGFRDNTGVYRAIMEAGLTGANLIELELPDSLYLQGQGWADNQKLCAVLGDWLDAHADLDAVCCAHDHLAAAVLSVLRARGRRVPDDVAVTGRGQMGEYFGLPAGELTTIDTRVGDAAAAMHDLLTRGVTADAGQTVLIRPHLVVGRSTVGDAPRRPDGGGG